MLAIDRTQPPRGAATRRLARYAEIGKSALLVDMPAFQVQRVVVAKACWLALIDDQRADQPTPQLLATGDMRVIPEAAGVGGDEVVVEVFTRQHRRLRHIRHAVHFQRQGGAMPRESG